MEWDGLGWCYLLRFCFLLLLCFMELTDGASGLIVEDNNDDNNRSLVTAL
jgi:hypothetical protein